MENFFFRFGPSHSFHNWHPCKIWRDLYKERLSCHLLEQSFSGYLNYVTITVHLTKPVLPLQQKLPTPPVWKFAHGFFFALRIVHKVFGMNFSVYLHSITIIVYLTNLFTLWSQNYQLYMQWAPSGVDPRCDKALASFSESYSRLYGMLLVLRKQILQYFSKVY